MKQLVPDTNRRMDRATTILARALGLIFGLGLLAVSVWCFTIADAVSRPTPGPADSAAIFQRQVSPFAFWATWLVLGAPLALLGLWILKATFKGTAAHRWLQGVFMRMEERAAKSATRHDPRTQPAGRAATAAILQTPPLAHSIEQSHDALASMPDDIRYTILARANKTAWLLGLISGGGLLLLGIAGVVFGIVAGFASEKSVPSGWYYWGAFKLEAAWVAASGASILLGIAILRSTLAGSHEKQSWLFPLRLFKLALSLAPVHDDCPD